MSISHLEIRRTATLALACGILLSVRPASAQTAYYFTTDATINSALSGPAYVGEDASGNKSSPTVQLVSGGSVNGLYTYGGSKVNISGGQANRTFGYSPFRSNDTSVVTLSAGSVGGPMSVSNNSTLFVTGGSVADAVFAADSGRVMVSGGTFASDLEVSGAGTVQVSGGSFAGNAIDTFYDGTTGAFTFIGTGLGATYKGPAASNGSYYTLTGRLQDGTSLNGAVIDVASGAVMFSLVNAPEPSQSAILGLGALGLAGMGLRRRKRF